MSSGRRVLCIFGWLAASGWGASAVAAPESSPAVDSVQPTWNRTLPLAADWALERGIDLPNPLGASVLVVTMSRDIEVYDVRVTLPGDEPVSISDIASFDVLNHTTLAALKLDAWLLPLLNVYVLVGHTWTETRLDAAITLDRPIGDDIVLELTEDSDVGGPLFGAGATAVAGVGPWFVLADANYNYTEIEPFADGITAWFLSARTGWSGDARWGGWRAWLGAAYLASDATLVVNQDVQDLGTIVVEVDQRPVNPLTYQAGASTAVGKRWEVLLEAGSNFDDAFVGVASVAFRF